MKRTNRFFSLVFVSLGFTNAFHVFKVFKLVVGGPWMTHAYKVRSLIEANHLEFLWPNVCSRSEEFSGVVGFFLFAFLSPFHLLALNTIIRLNIKEFIFFCLFVLLKNKFKTAFWFEGICVKVLACWLDQFSQNRPIFESTNLLNLLFKGVFWLTLALFQHAVTVSKCCLGVSWFETRKSIELDVKEITRPVLDRFQDSGSWLRML